MFAVSAFGFEPFAVNLTFYLGRDPGPGLFLRHRENWVPGQAPDDGLDDTVKRLFIFLPLRGEARGARSAARVGVEACGRSRRTPTRRAKSRESPPP